MEGDIQKDKTGGITFGNAGIFCALIKLLKIVDTRFLYFFMYIFVIPPTLISSSGAKSTYHYFHKKRGHGFFKSWWYTYKNHCQFGETVIDKFSMYGGKKFKIKFCGIEMYEPLLDEDGPFLQLSAHIGCNEILGYSYRTKKKCNVLVYGGEKESLMNYRQSKFTNSNMRMIPVGAENNHLVILEALENGEIICTYADRYLNTSKVVSSTIFGNEVHFAKSIFSLAVTNEIEVIMVNAMKSKHDTYNAYFKKLYYDKNLKKSEQIKQLADGYAKEIERLISLYPFQWYNYFETMEL